MNSEITKKVKPAMKSDMHLMPSNECTGNIPGKKFSYKVTLQTFGTDLVEFPITRILKNAVKLMYQMNISKFTYNPNVSKNQKLPHLSF